MKVNLLTYVTDLKFLSKSCEFGDLTDSFIKDKLVCGVKQDIVRSRLLRETDLTQQMKAMQGMLAEGNVDIIRKKVFKNKPSKSEENKAVTSQICGKCGYKYEPRKCPAFGKICKNCNKRNHFAKKCKSKKMHEVQDSDNDSDIFLNSIETEKQVNDWKVSVKILKQNVSVKLDTGAQCNVLPLHVYKQISNKPLKRSKSRLVSYSGHRLDTVGKVTRLVSSKDKYVPVEFVIVKNKAAPIFGLQTCLELNLISRLYGLNKSTTSEEILEKFHDVFEGLGCLSTEYKIWLDKDAKTVVHPPRKFPFALKNKVKNELSRLERMRVIQNVSEPTEWVKSLVVVEKPNKDVQLCLDPRDLSKSI